MFALLSDHNEDIRKFAIKNIKDVVDSLSNHKDIITPDKLNLLINHLLNSTCKKEIFEILRIISNLCYKSARFSRLISDEHLSLISYANGFISNFQNFQNLDFYIAEEFISILSYLISDNNSNEFNRERKIFENLNIKIIFNLYQEVFKLPIFIRSDVLGILIICLKINQPSSSKDKEFSTSFFNEVGKFFSDEKAFDVIIKIFNNQIVSETTIQVLEIFLCLVDIEKDLDLSYLSKNLNFELRISDLLKSNLDTKFLNTAFKLFNHLIDKDYNQQFFNIYDILNQCCPILDYIDKEYRKIMIVDSNINKTAHKESFKVGNKKTINTLFNNILYFFICSIEKTENFARSLFENIELMPKATAMIKMLSSLGINNSNKMLIENYLFIISLGLANEDIADLVFIVCIESEAIQMLCDFITTSKSHKEILNSTLRCIELMLSLASNLLSDSKNMIKIHLEKSGLDTIIDNLRVDNDDDIAQTANSIIEDFFPNHN